jgi:hypothetical protein
MWMRFSQSAHILWYVCQARVQFARRKRNRNARQRSRNLLMRNLLTAFDANRNHEMRRKIFLPRLQTFSTAHENFPRSQAYKNLFAQVILSYVRYRALRRQNSSIEIGFLFSEQREIALPGSCAARRRGPDHRNFAASFRCQLPLNFLHLHLYDSNTVANDVFFVPGHKCLGTGTFLSCCSAGDALGIWRQTATPQSAEWRARKRFSLSWWATASGRNTRAEKAGNYHHRGFARRKSNAKRFRKAASGIAGNSLRKHSGQRMGSTE